MAFWPISRTKTTNSWLTLLVCVARWLCPTQGCRCETDRNFLIPLLMVKTIFSFLWWSKVWRYEFLSAFNFQKPFPKWKRISFVFHQVFFSFFWDKNCLFSPRLSNSHWPHTNSGSFWEWSCITSRALLKRMSILRHKAVRHGGREGGKKRPLHKLADEKGRRQRKKRSCKLPPLLLSQIRTKSIKKLF